MEYYVSKVEPEKKKAGFKNEKKKRTCTGARFVIASWHTKQKSNLITR